MEIKHLFNCIIGFVLLLGCEGNISDQRLCGDPTCTEPVSHATTLLKYSSDDARILSFNAGAKVKVFSKSAGSRMDLWGVEINGRRGYAPKGFLREHRILKSKLDNLVLTETEDEYDSPTPEEKSDSSKSDQETQIVDGTTFFFDQSASIIDQTASLHLPDSSTKSIVQASAPNAINPSALPSQADTVVPNSVESEPPIHSSENPSIPSSNTIVPSFSQSESFFQATTVPNLVDPTLESTDPGLVKIEKLTQPIPISGLADPVSINAPPDSIEPSLTQKEPPVQPIISDHVDIPLDSGEPILIVPELPSPTAVPTLDQPPENLAEAESLNGDQEEEDDDDDDDDDDYFEEEEEGEGSTKGLYQYISSFLPGDGSGLKETAIPEGNLEDSDAAENILRENADTPLAFVEKENNFPMSDVQQIETSENTASPASIEASLENVDYSSLIASSQNSEPSVLITSSSENTDSSVLIDASSQNSDPSVFIDASSQNSDPSVFIDASSQNRDPSVLIETLTETIKIDEGVSQLLEVAGQDIVPSGSKSPFEGYAENTQANEPNLIVAESDRAINETDTEELLGKEKVVENLPFLQQPSIISADETLDKALHESNEDVSEDLAPSFFSLVSNYLSNLSNPFAKSEAEIEDVETSAEPLTQETCSTNGAARNCDSAASTPVDSPFEYPYDMSSTKGIFEEQNNTKLFYLIITAATVLLFTLGHYFIEKLRQDANYVAAINNLQKRLLISAAEVSSARAELDALQGSETVARHDNAEAVELTEKLIKSQNECAELEDQVACLQSELETATETGLDLNRMLSEYLATQHDSENDPLKSRVEDLQIQLNSQQGKILSMNELLVAKDSEIETLVKELMSVHIEANEVAAIRQELADLVNQSEAREASLGQLKYDLVVRDKEVTVAQECITQMSGTTPGQEDLQVLKDILDVAKVQADLQIITEERDLLRSQFEEEVNARKMLEDHRSVIREQITMLQEACRTAQSEKIEARTKLEVLSNYFKEKEDQHQKELISREANCIRQVSELSGEEIGSLHEQIANYRTQIETLNKEILDQERGFKDQIASLELKVHENWVAARQAERRSDELKQDAATLRNLLTIAEKQSTKQLGDRLPSPLHAGMPDCPPVAVMPPCLFPAPGSPHDRRPPPLGCMSSPPLLPPARYHHGFRPLSAPKGSNHSSGHSSESIEKYNNQV